VVWYLILESYSLANGQNGKNRKKRWYAMYGGIAVPTSIRPVIRAEGVYEK
jgi:hypothetical protein